MFSDAKKFLKYVEHVPEKFRTGHWSPVTFFVVYLFVAILLVSFPTALQTVKWTPVERYNGEFRTIFLQLWRLVGFLYGFVVIKLTHTQLGLWPFASYTFTSWNLMTLRCFLSFMGGFGFSSLQTLAEVVRFPALVGCTITVVIWWGVLVPIIDAFLRNNKQQRHNFWSLNQSPILVSVHFLNVIVAGLEFLLTSCPLSLFDLWIGCFVALLYCLFYLNVLVPQDIHFYIILAPQTAYCGFSYALILALYYATFLLWNMLLVGV